MWLFNSNTKELTTLVGRLLDNQAEQLSIISTLKETVDILHLRVQDLEARELRRGYNG